MPLKDMEQIYRLINFYIKLGKTDIGKRAIVGGFSVYFPPDIMEDGCLHFHCNNLSKFWCMFIFRYDIFKTILQIIHSL